MIVLAACSRCGVADRWNDMVARETVPGWTGLCGHCWAELETARLSGSMVVAWETMHEGDAWSPSHVSETWDPLPSAWEPPGPDDALLIEMASVRDRVCPDADLIVGPRLRDRPHAAGLTIRERGCGPSVFVCLATPHHPLMTLRHELMHAVWPRLEDAERATLGDEEEASERYADFFARLADRRPQLPSPTPAEAELFALIEAGYVGRRWV